MPIKRKFRGLGWKRDTPDIRDYIYSVPPRTMAAVPATIDLRPQCPTVYNQGRIGSCTANAIAGAIQFDRLKNAQNPDFVPSRLFIYYNERVIEGDVPLDGGAQIRDGIKSVAAQGVCPETEWPYDDTPAAYEGGPFPVGSPPATQPPQSCYNDAANYDITNYASVPQDLMQLKGCLAAGFPFIFGFSVYSSWYDQIPQPAVIALPSTSDTLEGGHAVLCVGYDDNKQMFTIRNSWGVTNPDGSQVGDNGYFYMPYAYMTNSSLADDFWVINAVMD